MDDIEYRLIFPEEILKEKVKRFILRHALIEFDGMHKRISPTRFQFDGEMYSNEFKRIRKIIMELLKDLDVTIDELDDYLDIVKLNI